MKKSIWSRFLIAYMITTILIPALPAALAEGSPKTPPKKPSSDLKLEDLGYNTKELQADPEKQRLLEIRTSKLKTHQVMGLITLGLMTATLFTAEEHKAPSAHKALGIATGISYFTTAYFSLSAPDADKKGDAAWNVRLHKALAWLHFPLMILTPVAGLLAERQIERGETLHGLAKHKSTLGSAAFATFAPAAAMMIIDF